MQAHGEMMTDSGSKVYQMVMCQTLRCQPPRPKPKRAKGRRHAYGYLPHCKVTTICARVPPLAYDLPVERFHVAPERQTSCLCSLRFSEEKSIARCTSAVCDPVSILFLLRTPCTHGLGGNYPKLSCDEERKVHLHPNTVQKYAMQPHPAEYGVGTPYHFTGVEEAPRGRRGRAANM